MKKSILLMLLPMLLSVAESRPQQTRVVFYNAENLFDTEDDTLTDDNEFLPEGDKHWNYERFWRKVVRIYQVITAMGEGDMPAIIGLCEVENRKVLEKLIYDTPLRQFNYRIIHQDSPDARGIDVAVLYRADIFKPDSLVWIPIILPDGSKTRDILHVNGVLWEKYRIHVFVNHWPSRYGGAFSSKGRRMAAAEALKRSVELILAGCDNPNIIIGGDFNDEPEDESIKLICSVSNPDDSLGIAAIVNYSIPRMSAMITGTIKHQGRWSIFDQILVSDALLKACNGLRLISETAEIFDAGFLLETDEAYTGHKPFRTYFGPSYHGGFSDHLPVSVIIGISE